MLLPFFFPWLLLHHSFASVGVVCCFFFESSGIWSLASGIMYDIFCSDLHNCLVCFRLDREVPIVLLCFRCALRNCVCCVFNVMKGSVLLRLWLWRR